MKSILKTINSFVFIFIIIIFLTPLRAKTGIIFAGFEGNSIQHASKGIEENNGFAEDMEAAMKLHEEAKDYNDEYKASQAFVELTDKYPSEWLPVYWSSYLYTQLINILVQDSSVAPEGTTIEDMILTSQEHLNTAKERKGKMTASEEADFHNLQGLIYFFKARTAKTEDEKNKYLSMRTKTISKAITLEPDNPNALVMAATELIRYGYNEEDLQKVVGGKLLLESAKATYEKGNSNRSMTTYWAKDFVNFWLRVANDTIRNFGQNSVN